MIAGNSGRPAGGCGDRNRVQKIHAHHRTQEEDVFSSWMLTECTSGARGEFDQLFQHTIAQRWGLADQRPNSTDTRTVQGVDYVHTQNPNDYGDAWVVRNAKVCAKVWQDQDHRGYVFDTSATAPCTLTFVAGPNAGKPFRKEGSMARTKNIVASRNYSFFQECVRVALRAGLDAMICENVDVALVTRLSCGVYAGVHKHRINGEFLQLVNAVLAEPVLNLGGGRTVARGMCFKDVIIPMLCTCRGGRKICHSCQASKL